MSGNTSWMSSLDRLFRPGFPFPEGEWKQSMPDGKQISDYVQQSIRKATDWMTKPLSHGGRLRTSGSASSRAAKVSQSGRSVIVKVRIAPYVRRADVQVAHDSNNVYVRGIGQGPLRVPLPAPVRTRGGSAKLRKNTLEIRLNKSRRRAKCRELWVQY